MQTGFVLHVDPLMPLNYSLNYSISLFSAIFAMEHIFLFWCCWRIITTPVWAWMQPCMYLNKPLNENKLLGCLHFLTLPDTYCLLLFFTVWLPKLWGTCGVVSSTSHWLTVWNNWQMVLFSLHFFQAEAMHAHGSVRLILGQEKTAGLSKRPRVQTEKLVVP